ADGHLDRQLGQQAEDDPALPAGAAGGRGNIIAGRHYLCLCGAEQWSAAADAGGVYRGIWPSDRGLVRIDRPASLSGELQRYSHRRSEEHTSELQSRENLV